LELKMRRSFAGALIATGAVWFAFAPASNAQANYSSRQTMEQCVSRVLAIMAKSKAPETQVGSAVTTKCDSPLRATLADAIKRGEAAGCTVEGCLDLARTRASAEAIAAYRQIIAR
jgi:hypothetical protein